jgi:hypothetical protein
MPSERLSQYRWFLLDAVQLAATGLTALALVPGGSHAFDMLAKLQLGPAEYTAIERLQHGSSLFVVAGTLALIALGLHTYLVRSNAVAYGWSLAAMLSVGAAQLAFWLVGYPVSVETEGWTHLPADFEAARRNWEYAFAATGMLAFGGLLALVRAIEASRPIASMSILKSIENDAAVRAARMRARQLDAQDDGERGMVERSRAA